MSSLLYSFGRLAHRRWRVDGTLTEDAQVSDDGDTLLLAVHRVRSVAPARTRRLTTRTA